MRRVGLTAWRKNGVRLPVVKAPRLQNSVAPLANMNRRIEPELLDELPASDPRAIRSRRDLRRVNALMGNAGVIARAVLQGCGGRPPRQLVDLGAGDGTFMLRLAKRLSPAWPNVEVTFVDRQDIVNARTRREFEALSWSEIGRASCRERV